MSQSIIIELQSFPPVDFFIKGMRANSIFLEAQENYRKGSYRNRYLIAGPNGIQRLSIPLLGGKHQQQPIQKVRIDNSGSWSKEHWKAIQSAYGRAPFFIHYEQAIEALFAEPKEYLWDWNLRALNQCIKLLGITFDLVNTSIFEKEIGNSKCDFRNQLLPKNQENTSYPDFKYAQVFEDRHGYLPNLSILDLLFCQGPQAAISLKKAALKDNL